MNESQPEQNTKTDGLVSSQHKKVLIIPDIHLRHVLVDRIISHEKHDKVLFLGDHFDQFNDSSEQNRRAAIWIRERMIKHPEDEWCMGNHDLAYAWPGRHTSCAGYTEAKAIAINDIMRPEDWAKFKFYHWLAPDWLASHAGLHDYFIEEGVDLKAYLEAESLKCQEALKQGKIHWFFVAGKCRGGPSQIGGLVWLDFNEEFSCVANLNQVFGHTNLAISYISRVELVVKPGKLIVPSIKSYNYNLDTNNLYYGVWDGEKLTTKCIIDELPGMK